LDKITIKSLKYSGLHGYYDREREDGNVFEIDATAKGDFKSAIENNDLDQTFNYEIVEEVAGKILAGKSEKLIETLCKKIGDDLFERSPHVKELAITVRKLNPPIKTPAAYAEITMVWKR
tara:strand:+ start:16387 stop:16746 length:360 start_codon:yes stop_codon:yes gene_type:complete